MKPQISLLMNVKKKTLKKLWHDIREARIRRHISMQLMANRVGTTRVTLIRLRWKIRRFRWDFMRHVCTF